MNNKTLRLVSVGLLSFNAIAFGVDLPQYKLRPGETLDFSTSSRAKSTDGNASGSEGRIRVEVAAARGDGWRIVYFITDDYWQGGRPTPSTKPATAGEMGVAFLHADGRLDLPPDTFRSVSTFLPPLPGTNAQAKDGYAVDELFGSRAFVSVASNDGSTWVLSIRHESPENSIYLISSSTEAAFDADRGVPVRIDTNYTQDYGFHEKGTQNTRLTGIGQNGADRAQRFSLDLDTYLAVTKQVESANDSGPQKNTHSIEALTTARKTMATPEIVAKLDERLSELQHPPERQSEQTDKQAALLNQPMPDWTLDKVGGGKLSLHDLRGKVVLLDFWYRGCGWCVRAMPQIKRLAKDYKDKGVVVIGMNVDSDEKDAAFVIDKLGLPYATVKTTFDDARKSGVFGYPTLIILDRNGVVRKFDIGYSPTLRHDLGEKIDDLLSQK